MKIIVTGAAGFIGYHLIRKLLTRPDVDEVCGIDRNDTPLARLLEDRLYHFDHEPDRYKFIATDLAVGSAFQYLPDFDVIVHLAACSGVARAPNNLVVDNILATNNVCFLAKHSGAHLIFASSGAVYHAGRYYGSLYGIAKMAAEKLIAQELETYTVLRFANVYGWQPRPKAVIGSWITQILSGCSLSIARPGSQSRDFIHVDDVVDAIEKAIDTDPYRDAYDICTEELTSIENLSVMVRNAAIACGLRPLPVVMTDSNPGAPTSPMSRVRAGNILGWEPRITLEDGLIRTFRERMQNENRDQVS
jgi:UDP-glucuronate 4-epimerase